MNMLARAIAFAVLAGALLAAAIAFNNRHYPSDERSRPLAGNVTVHNAELARCRSIGREAAADSGCKAVWKANRQRFLQSRKDNHDD
jgi:conjugative transfer region protein TrbK